MAALGAWDMVARRHARPCVLFNGDGVAAAARRLVVPTSRKPRARRIHTSPSKEREALLASSPPPPPPPYPAPAATAATAAAATAAAATPPSALSILSLSQILRSYLITSISSSPALLGASAAVLRRMLDSPNPLFSVERNPLLRVLLWETFYKQFCAGETTAGAQAAGARLRRQGYSGVILEYALEVLKDSEGHELADVAVWRKGMLDTIAIATAGDFVGLKWSGMGPAAMRLMKATAPPSPAMSEAMHAVCQAAAARDVSLLPAAEETWSLAGFDAWCMDMQRTYNRHGRAVVYTTYQAYLKQIPGSLAAHLAMARAQGFTLGVKLVRGAYLGSEVRDKIYPTIEATHHAYDSIADALIHRRYNDVLRPASSSGAAAEEPSWPHTNVVIATHNMASVQKAQALRQAQAARGEALTPLAFAQLQGMADEVSCSLIAAAKAADARGQDNAVRERVLKCTTWGSMYECLNYLLRRVAENKDAATRTSETREAMRTELARRFKAVLGVA